MTQQHSDWHLWNKRNSIAGIKFPGIYLVACSDVDLHGSPFEWLPEIIYIGMTNSGGGLKSRLKQFDDTISRKRFNHGGADRVLYKHRDNEALSRRLYVSVVFFKCDTKSKRPIDLRMMGEVAKCEYDCFAEFVERFGHLPEFNNQSLSKKYSKTLGRE